MNKQTHNNLLDFRKVRFRLVLYLPYNGRARLAARLSRSTVALRVQYSPIPGSKRESDLGKSTICLHLQQHFLKYFFTYNLYIFAIH